MELQEIMTREVETIRSTASLQSAAQKMALFDIGMLPVVEHTQLVGAITDRDITVRAVACGFDPKVAEVRTVMNPVVVCGYAWQDVQAGLQLMTDHQIRRLPIVNKADQLIGIVSLGDLAKVMPNKQLLSEALERISEARRLEPVAS